MKVMQHLSGSVATPMLVLALLAPAAAATRTQTPPPTSTTQAPPPATQGAQKPKPAPQTGQDPDTTPAIPPQNLDRIRRGLTRDSVLSVDSGQVRFYMEILAKLPRIEEIIGKYDLMNGPTRRGAPMTHQEYLAMVTPREMYGSAGIKPVEVLQFTLVNWLGQAFVKRVVEDLRNASSEREIQAIRDRIDRELAALRGRNPSN
jgi:hypothetical protein